MSTRYIIDTTVLEDYYIKKLANVQSWLDPIFAQNEDKIIILPIVLMEFIKRSHYRKNQEKTIRNMINGLKKINSVEVAEHTVLTIGKLIKNLKNFPTKPIIQIGEFSFLQESHDPNLTVVSSDKGALVSFKLNYRVNPQHNPPKEYRIGQDFK